MSTLANFLFLNRRQFSPVVPFDQQQDKLAMLNLTASNTELTGGLLRHLPAFEQYVQGKIHAAGARYAYGGYNEHRTVYDAFEHFSDQGNGEPRRLHLGVDIWGPAGTPVMAPFGGLVHSFGYHDQPGNYGATILLSHQLEDRIFYTLYGHLSLKDIDGLRAGTYLVAGEVFAHLGTPAENGQWPPHLHFQVIEHLGTYSGDYPGVCKYSERSQWLANCPDPELMLNML